MNSKQKSDQSKQTQFKQPQFKQQVAAAALDYIEYDTVIGIGTGSTVNYFIELLVKVKSKIDACVSSSKDTTARLKALGLPVVDLNVIGEFPLYIDGADEINQYLQMIKGGGGALTSEKILASCAKKFICIADESKRVDLLGQNFSLPIEVIPQARSAVGRAIVKLGGNPIYRENFLTDHGNVILDIQHLDLTDPIEMEKKLNTIPGVVENGIFAQRTADILLVAGEGGIDKITKR